MKQVDWFTFESESWKLFIYILGG